MDDLISRKAVIDAIEKMNMPEDMCVFEIVSHIETEIATLPSAEPEPLSEAYMKAVWTWLINYQIKASELNGKYSPCEVLSWVANDWRMEHLG